MRGVGIGLALVMAFALAGCSRRPPLNIIQVCHAAAEKMPVATNDRAGTMSKRIIAMQSCMSRAGYKTDLQNSRCLVDETSALDGACYYRHGFFGRLLGLQ